MTPEVRRSVAFIGARLVGRRKGTAIYDFSASKYTYFTGTITGTISLYDHDARVHITGQADSFYHYGAGGFISLKVHGKSFSGYDYASGSHYSGNVSQSNITLFDHSASQHFYYLLT